MSKNLDKITIAAFADGELDVQQNLQVLSEVNNDPETAGQVKHQQQLRLAVNKSMTNATPPLPDALRSQIEAMADEMAAAEQPSAPAQTSYTGPSVVGRIGNWVPAAVAAILLIAAMPGYFAMTSHNGKAAANSNSIALAGYNQIIPVSETQRFVRRHVSCSSGMVNKMLHADQFPQSLQKVPPAIAQFIHTEALPNLDLSNVGYEFTKMGECIIPGDQSVHLIYHAKHDSGRTDAISLWMKKYDGKPTIEPNQMYVLADETTPHPLLMWRDAEMIYYVAGDNLGSAIGVMNTLQAK